MGWRQTVHVVEGIHGRLHVGVHPMEVTHEVQ
jgi:hypothetical protein